MTVLKLDKNKCKNCNKCTYVCPLGIFKSDNSSTPIIDEDIHTAMMLGIPKFNYKDIAPLPASC